MFHRIGSAAYKANLDNTIALCNLLNHPKEKFKSVASQVRSGGDPSKIQKLKTENNIIINEKKNNKQKI